MAPSDKTSTAIVVTDKCIIRPYMLEDAQAISAAANDPAISINMTNGFPHPYGLEQAHAWLKIAMAPEHPEHFAICLPDNTPIGAIGLKHIGPPDEISGRTREVGYWLGKAWWGRGIMTEAVRSFTLWAFRQHDDFLRVEATVFEGNEGSIRVMEKAGYVKEGVLRKSVWKGGVAKDRAMYSCIREDIEGLE